jgi:preprotein translocase SecE subunit
MAKAVADINKLEKRSEKGDDGGENRKPEWLTQGMGWGPRKFAELKAFFIEVRTELKKVTWPSRREVYATTVVVIVTTLFFGFYLWLLDVGLSWLYEHTVGRL